MARFLLIHGACHGAWCWRDVLPCLAARGHDAKAIDLPSHGEDPRDPRDITLADYRDAIVNALDPDTILVGHSMGGFPITAAAIAAPGRIARLIYLCAYVPLPGLSLAEMRRAGPRQLLADAIRVSDDRMTMTFDPAKLEEKFYHDCPRGILDHASLRLCAQPVAPQETALQDTAAAEDLPRSYIRCADDRAIPPEYQATMASGLDRYDLQCGHSPFFACPDDLATLLDRIAQ